MNLNRYYRKPLLKAATGEGEDLPGEDYGNDFTPTDVGDEVGTDLGAGDGAAGSGGKGAEGEADGEGEAGEGEAGEGGGGALRDGADAPATGAEDGEKATDTGTPKGKGKFIPLDRHEKLLKKERARREQAEAELAQGRAGQEVARTNAVMGAVEDELVAMEEKYNDLLAEGDTKGAAQMMTQIRRKNAELTAAQSAQRDAEVMARAVEKVRYDEALDRVEEAYPMLDPDSDEYDEDAYQDVVDLMQAGRQRGLSPTKALQRAVARVMGADSSAQKRATTVTPRVDESAVGGRRAEAVKRNIDAAKRTPPATHRVGAGNDAAGGALTTKAVMSMSDADFDKLSDKDLARLRGDIM